LSWREGNWKNQLHQLCVIARKRMLDWYACCSLVQRWMNGTAVTVQFFGSNRFFAHNYSASIILEFEILIKNWIVGTISKKLVIFGAFMVRHRFFLRLYGRISKLAFSTLLNCSQNANFFIVIRINWWMWCLAYIYSNKLKH
jgi:hypothetical protein